MFWFDTKKNRHKKEILVEIGKEVSETYGAMGFKSKRIQKGEIEQATKFFATKEDRTTYIGNYLFPEIVSNENFEEFFNSYKRIKEREGICLDEMEERFREFDRLAMKTNNVFVEASFLGECFIYAQGDPFVKTKELNLEQVKNRIQTVKEKNKKRKIQKRIRKIEQAVEKITETDWEEMRKHKNRMIISALDKVLEQVMFVDCVYGELEKMLAQDMEIIWLKAVTKAKKVGLL